LKTVSVVIPNYNNAHYLKSAITSILNQTFTDYEIIVVDDGSTDNSRDVVGAFGNKVRYIWQENKGLGGARNTGILASKTEFIGLLDADDEWRPDFLEKMMALAQSHPDAVVYFSCAQGMDSSGNELPQIFGRAISSNEIYQNLLRANFIIPSTVVFRRSTIVDVGLFEEKNRKLHGCEDWDLWLRLSPSHPFAGTTEPLVRYRLHPQTFSANPGHMQEAVQTVIEKNFGLDDGDYANWSAEKRRAFGGVCRYRVLTSIQKQGNWDDATLSLRKAFEIDPTLVGDLDLFYELSFGSQPSGYRETAHGLDLEQNIQLVTKMLEKVFEGQSAIVLLRRRAFATASHAMGLVAYNTNQRALSRRLFFRTILLIPKLLLEERIIYLMVRSYLNPSLVKRLKRFINGGTYADVTK
jgi:glycosyltransferase involved in cell wall biosynthesis